MQTPNLEIHRRKSWSGHYDIVGLSVIRSLYIATIKQIIPLPDPSKPETYPENDYIKGSDVLAMYPDTTTFYLGRVVAPPPVPHSAGKREGGSKKDKEAARSYKIAFEDDEHPHQVIPREFIAGGLFFAMFSSRSFDD